MRLGESNGAQTGVLPRDASAEQIDAAIRAVAAVVRPAGAPQPSFDAMPEPGEAIPPHEGRGPRRDWQWLSNKAVARQLGISQQTVKFHVESLMRKPEWRAAPRRFTRVFRQQLIEM